MESKKYNVEKMRQEMKRAKAAACIAEYKLKIAERMQDIERMQTEIERQQKLIEGE